MIAVTPLLYFMLAKKWGATQLHSFANHSRSNRSRHSTRCRCAGVIPRLRADIGVIQGIDLFGAILRLAILVILAFIFLNAVSPSPSRRS